MPSMRRTHGKTNTHDSYLPHKVPCGIPMHANKKFVTTPRTMWIARRMKCLCPPDPASLCSIPLTQHGPHRSSMHSCIYMQTPFTVHVNLNTGTIYLLA